ncbi:MAG TPA: AAA family ATPase [Smithellaceae bacterium]|nr:AAA family ATPase [Smithellaceae bacterium]
MDYFNILNFKKEPFSNSPEPEFLLQLPQYSDCLQKLELAVRLRRGINVVVGDIGTGKTTLCRKLIQNLSSPSQDAEASEIETHLLLDPAFKSTAEFLQTCASMLGIGDFDDGSQSEWHLKERIKDKLFDKGVDKRRIVVLIIDEGQKIPDDCLEILREFLNYETNKFKLLQIIIFAQKEFHAVLKRKANLLDRVNLLYYLYPLNFRQMRAMIDYRLDVARNFQSMPSIFSLWGFVAVYLSTGGYPRRVVFLCHQVILKMIIRNKKRAGWFLVRSCRDDITSTLYRKLEWALAGLLLIVVLGVSVSAITFQHINTDAKKQISSLPAGADFPDAKNTVTVRNVSEAPVIEETDVKMPDSMGKISMTKKRTIWWVSYNIYGDNGPQIMEKIFAVNPHINNRNLILAGSVITLPAIPADVKPLNQRDMLVVLESGQDLEIMYNLFRNNPRERILPPLAFFSSWNRKTGFEHAVVIDKCFKDVESAREQINKLPQVVAEKAKILSRWDEDTVFFNRRILSH